MFIYPRDEKCCDPRGTRPIKLCAKNRQRERGSLKIVSEFPSAGTIGSGLLVSTIILEIVHGDRPDDFVDVLLCLKLKWPQKYAKQGIGIRVIVRETPLGPVSLKGFDLRPVSSHSIKPLSSFASNPFKG